MQVTSPANTLPAFPFCADTDGYPDVLTQTNMNPFILDSSLALEYIDRSSK